MISSKPYLIRALHAWIIDNGWTPYILVNTAIFGCQVPKEHVKDDRIVFNIALGVVEDLVLGNASLEFTARFSGVRSLIRVPIAAVLAIYAKENNEGMAFSPEDAASVEDLEPVRTPVKGKPTLKIVE
jgi:stringent starvation protein B